MNLAPIALFVYNRPRHAMETVKSVMDNSLAKDTDLIIFSDGARNKESEKSILEVRNYLETIQGFKSVKLIFREKNFGLAKSIISGVTEVLETNNEVIVLEDDMKVSSQFLNFMNSALEFYHSDQNVAAIHGWNYPVKVYLPNTFFLKDPGCWSWATWRKGWKYFNPDGKYLLEQLEKRNLTYEFDYQGSFNFTGMLKDQVEGRNDSWAIRWYASLFLKNMLTLHPNKTYINNIGMDYSGIHSIFDQNLDSTELNFSDSYFFPKKISENIEARKIIIDYLKESYNLNLKNYKNYFYQKIKTKLF